jgi:hypothetical protein
MSEWTESARRVLNEYCVRSKECVAASGADADEVSEDLRRHVEEEVRSARIGVVTEADIRRILTKVGEPQSAPFEPTHRQTQSARAKPDEDLNHFAGFLLVSFGVALPIIALFFEWFTGFSAGVLFDPIPNWFQSLAVAAVPVLNLWTWRAGVRRERRWSTWLGWLNGATAGICLFYALLYLPFVPFAAIGVIYFGLGLIPLSPLLALLATPALRARYCQRIGAGQLPGGWRGAGVAFMLLCLAQLPSAVTYYGLARATSDDPGIKAQGIRVLRQFGDRDMILRASYGLLRRELDLDVVRWIASGDTTISAEEAREAYYRVTGQSFNSVPPPRLYTRAGRWTALEEEFAWDEALGGESVAQRVKGLSMLSSRLDAVAEPDPAVVYCEWTMEFKNISSQPREARAQVAIPPGAVVSRVTLWINGEEREAAFGGRAQTRAAYQEVAVVQRRDPILVTTCGPDRVLVQCFPVPPNGGVMKVKLGVTAPLLLDAPERGQFVWPHFLERNFSVPSNFRHELWIASPQRLSDGNTEAAKPVSPEKPFTLRQSWREADASRAIKSVTIERTGEVKEVWTADADGREFIQQRLEQSAVAGIRRLLLVLDGSAGMDSFARQLSEAIGSLPNHIELKLLIASDSTSSREDQATTFQPERVDAIQRRLSRAKFQGGQDNLPALMAAWDWASAVEGGAVLWVHGPTPVLLSAESGLLQRLERNTTGTRLFEAQTAAGPDRILEKLDGRSALLTVPRVKSLREDLARLIAQWSGNAQQFEFKREKTPNRPNGVPSSRHIERLWARDESQRLAHKRKIDEAMKLAVKNQLVTPVSGAVVLERKEQYDRHRLTPAGPETVPAVPEPTALSLVGLGLAAIAIARKRAARLAGGKGPSS